MSIALNSISKFQVRVLPSLLEYMKRYGRVPERLSFSFAALIAFYKGKRGNDPIPLNDSPENLSLFKTLWASHDGSRDSIQRMVREVLGKKEIWKDDLNEKKGLSEAVSDYLCQIETRGMEAALNQLCRIS
jgi:tagaturonate reductase